MIIDFQKIPHAVRKDCCHGRFAKMRSIFDYLPHRKNPSEQREESKKACFFNPKNKFTLTL
jgi:hypothetical protein